MFYLIFINFFTFIIFGIDKRKALKNKRRISENTLLIITFLGGTIGSVLGMFVFRHKISKNSFLLKFGGVVLLQIVMGYFLFNTLNYK
ncbi:DUF1294 domain-containing protein [Chryseobacterium oryctis]|uniref:DUF1294 domain-containing protein n=1 Tax=Chryseobacterium oryctis TaxID=2952618 RepID=A0ABT3HMU5_9FLAO|nr:DUF1294 domain-containing protein [Chryseobacterium oryctis]MCW3161118.1 DUF1294 domain-containing protein [Chryseobacterium oryctis]